MFAITREPVNQWRHVRHCNKVFWRHMFWGVNNVFLTSFVTSGRGNPKFWRCQNKSVVLFKDVQIKIQTCQKNSFYIKSVGHDPKDVKIQKIMYSTNFWWVQREIYRFVVCVCISSFHWPISSVLNTKKLKIKEHVDILILQHPTKFETKMLRREKLW